MSSDFLNSSERGVLKSHFFAPSSKLRTQDLVFNNTGFGFEVRVIERKSETADSFAILIGQR